MKIFENIKNGVMPNRETIVTLLNSEYSEENSSEEINRYIEILENSYMMSRVIHEKVLLNEVIFVLRLISESKKDAIYDYLDNFLILNVHKVSPDDVKFFDEIIEVFGVDTVIEYINERLLIVDTLDKESLRSILNWTLHKIWTAKSFFNNSKFMSLYENAKSLLYKLIEQNRVDEVMYLEFFIYHIMGNNFQTQDDWRTFNREINKVCSKLYLQYKNSNNLIKPNPTKKEKIRIALIRDRIVNNSPYMVEYSLLKALQESQEFTDKYELAIYSMNYFEKNPDDQKLVQKFLDIGIPVVSPATEFIQDGYYHNHLDKALKIRQTLIEDNIDIMIGTVSGYDIMGFLFTSRVAPLQIYWSHGNFEYDIEGIDRRITHITGNRNQSKYDFEIFDVEILEEFLNTNEEENIKKAKKIRKRFGEDSIILGSIGRLVKVNSDAYLESVAEIMQEYKEAVYLACGAGNIEEIKEKVEKLGIGDRFYFEGHIDAHIYGYVIDIYLDTFPEPGGQSLLEFCSKENGLVVSKSGRTIEEYVVLAKKYIYKKELGKYEQVSFKKDDFWNFTLLKDNKELFLSYDNIIVDENEDFLLKILEIIDNIKIIITSNDLNRLIRKINNKQLLDRFIVEDNIYERALKSDFFIFFEQDKYIFEFVKYYTNARDFRKELFMTNEPIWKITFKKYNKVGIFKDVFGKLTDYETDNIDDGMWFLLKDCFSSYDDFKEYFFSNELQEKFILERLRLEANNPRLLAKIKIMNRLNKVEDDIEKDKSAKIKKDKINSSIEKFVKILKD